MSMRFVGVDVGAETVKLVELVGDGGSLRLERTALREHAKDPAGALCELLVGVRWGEVAGAAVTGRLARVFRLPRIPEKAARAEGFRFFGHEGPATLVSIGGHGFSVLELRAGGIDVYRENSRCSQGTGNFLRQLVERFGLTVEGASSLCADVADPAPLSGRCPVILKTDMTHLANVGHSHARIVAGLYDAVCENVQVLVKPRLSPERVALVGGVMRSRRIRESFRRFLDKHGMVLLELSEDEALFMEAAGTAVHAARRSRTAVPSLAELVVAATHDEKERLPPLVTALSKVRRLPASAMPEPKARPAESCGGLVLGLDIGSTGSKAVAIGADDGALVWEAYGRTGGNPVGAAQSLVRQLLDGPWGSRKVRSVGVTGSGREIVGSLLYNCFGAERVFVMNEIAAHAEGALHHDGRVDTIFEIGGQDAKYIRIAAGRVVDAAMNEACSAGTGSFIEEQGRCFSAVRDVAHLGDIALGADAAVSLGQHCSVFMAEIIDEAVAAGTPQPRIVAGIYESIIQNYMNRVKGSRTVGEVVFCQGMPFSADALAAAVARQTGSEVIVPPNPGTIGAFGIALLTLRERAAALATSEGRAGLPLERFLEARVVGKDTFVCKSTEGCGGTGNKCRIDRIGTVVEGVRQKFTWGGGCSLYDRGSGRIKLPDGAPDPFREREELVDALVAALPEPPRGRERVAITDEFALKGLFPFFATYLAELGVGLDVTRSAGQKALRRGIEEANIPFCAPMQLYHGAASLMAEQGSDFLFLPMLISTVATRGESRSVLCPIVQASADINRWDLAARGGQRRARILSPLLDIRSGGLSSSTFLAGLDALASELGVHDPARRSRAHRRAVAAQELFEARCLELGRRALAFAEARGIVPVVVLGRAYTVYNHVLNSNVPAILREQGALAVPVDCYPVGHDVPVFEDVYWGYGQQNLRAAHQIRRTPGLYSVWCSNYACGPDSFTLHFYAYLMDGKPFTVIETDGHSGDAGTRTRLEAFLHCVRGDLRDAPAAAAPPSRAATPLRSLRRIEQDKTSLSEIRARGERLLIPRMGPGAEPVAAMLRGLGIAAEALPRPDAKSLAVGRRHTSGKECVPMAITLGSLLTRLESETDPSARFAFFMPSARGPCRFGVYNVLHKIVLERLGWRERVRVWSPSDDDYFEGIPAGVTALAFCGFMAADLLLAAYHHVRPAEARPGAAAEIYERYKRRLDEQMTYAAGRDLSAGRALVEAATGSLFGCADLLAEAGRELAAVCRPADLPVVLVVGEIYVRCDPSANDDVIERLLDLGVRAHLAPFTEWLDYQEYINTVVGIPRDVAAWVSAKVQARIQSRSYDIMAEALGWPPMARAKDSVLAAAPYVRQALEGEAVLTLGGALHETHVGRVSGVLSVAPLECMPSKIAETQLVHAAEREGVLSLTLALNGDPVDPQLIESFVFQIKERFARPGARQPVEVVAPDWLKRTVGVAREVVRGFPLPMLPFREPPEWRGEPSRYATPPDPDAQGAQPHAAAAPDAESGARLDAPPQPEVRAAPCQAHSAGAAAPADKAALEVAGEA